MNHAFALGVKVEYQGIFGTITFVDTEYLTICTKTSDDSMTGPVCLVVYSYLWDNIKVLNSHHRE